MKSIIYSIVLCLFLGFYVSNKAQNVGVGIAVPAQKMHVAGNLRTDNAMIMWPGAFAANNAIAINVQYSTVRITNMALVQTNAVSYTAAASEGQVLFISNEDGDPATFVGTTIPANESRSFIYTNGIWRPTTGTGASSGWALLGNAGTTPATNFVGTTDAQDLVFRSGNTPGMRLLQLAGTLHQLYIYDVTMPVSTPGNGKLTLQGLASSWPWGPHVDFKYDGDPNSAMHIQNYAHDNSALTFDAFYTGPGNWISSHAGSNFQIKKNLNLLNFNYNTGFAAGTIMPSWNTGMVMTTVGNVGIGNAAPTSRLHVTGGVRIVDGTQGDGKIFTSDASGNGTWRYPAIATKAIWLASGTPNTDPLVTASWALIYDTGTNDQLRIENPAASPTTIKYSYSINNGVPVSANLAPGAFVVITGFVCSSDLRIQVSRYSTVTDQNHISFTGMGMCNGWIRGIVMYDL